MPKPNLVDAKTVLSNDGRKVRVLFYDDGSYRFRVYDCPLVLEEAYLSGNAQLNSIIKLAPKLPPPAEPAGLSSTNVAEPKTLIQRARATGDAKLLAGVVCLLEEGSKARGLLVDAVTRAGNHPGLAPIVPEIQELTGTSDFGS